MQDEERTKSRHSDCVIQEEFADLCLEIGELKEEVIKVSGDYLHRLDRLIGLVEAVQIDNSAGAETSYRHTKQIQLIAESVGIDISNE